MAFDARGDLIDIIRRKTPVSAAAMDALGRLAVADALHELADAMRRRGE